MALEITRPFWLAALVVVLPLVYYSRRGLVQLARWQRAASLAVRILLVVVLVAALCGARIIGHSRQQSVVFTVDHSASITAEGRQAADAFLEEARRHAGDDRVELLPFAAEAVADADRLQTDLAAAIVAAEAAIPAAYVPRIVVLSDGNQTVGDAVAAAKAAAMPISTAPLPGLPSCEVYIAGLDAQAEVRLGEPLDVNVLVQSTHDDDGKVQLLRASEVLLEQAVHVTKGENRLQLRCSLLQRMLGRGAVPFSRGENRDSPQAVEAVQAASSQLLTVQLDGFKDTLAGNNQVSVEVSITGKPRVLLVDSQPELAGRLVEALRAESIDVDVRTPSQIPPRLEDLEAYDVLILSNVPAALLPAAEMAVVQEYVRDFGGGLITIGGDRAFIPGGYGGTILEEVLPVDCHVRKDRPKPVLAMVLVIDRSASMEGESIELAKEATRRAVKVLGPEDMVGIIAFEDDSRWVSEIRPCSDNKYTLGRIETITTGGGTNMFPAMQKAYLALREVYADLKHMIVLTDGLSQPGDFEALGRDISAAGITVSTVAVGREAAQALLQDIARLGRGHFYYCDTAAAVPEVFALEAIGAGKVGISEEPFAPQVVEAGGVLAGLDLGGLPTLWGYNQTRPKAGCQVVLAAGQNEPLLAWWQCGSGVSMVFTSDVHERWAAEWSSGRWPGFGPFWAKLVRQVMRRTQPGRRGRVIGYAEELRPRPTNEGLLQAIAEASGGQYAPRPAEVFGPHQRTVRRRTILWPYLLTAAVLLLLVDVALRRIDLAKQAADDR